MIPSTTLLSALLINIVPLCSAWGAIGHEIIGNIAYNMLSDHTREAVTDFLFPNGYTFDDDYDDGSYSNFTSPIAAVANWADKVRYTKAFAWTTPFHFVDVMDAEIPGGCHPQGNCTFLYERDCKGDKCAVGAIVEFSHMSIGANNGRQSDENNDLKENVSMDHHRLGGFIRRGLKGLLLSGVAAPFAVTPIQNITRRESLMFLIHIVGDVHQPLHVSRASDKGGNTIHVEFPSEFKGYRDQRYGHAHKKWNLHSVWDTGIIEHAIDLYYSIPESFQVNIEKDLLTKENIQAWLACPSGLSIDCVTDWAKESFLYAMNYAYQNEEDEEVEDGDHLTDEYFISRLEIVKRRLAAGGLRLASTLEDIFGGGGGTERSDVKIKRMLMNLDG